MAQFRNIALVLLLGLLSIGSLYSQPVKDTLDKVNVRYAADIHYHNQDYDLALTEYRKLYKADSTVREVNQLLANCYRFLGNKDFMGRFLKKVIDAGARSPENLYHYSDALRHTHEYEAYKDWSLQYIAAYEQASNRKGLPKPPNWQKDISNDSMRFKVEKVAFNGIGPDYSPGRLKYGWLYASAGMKGAAGDPMKVWYGAGKDKEGPIDPFKIKGKIGKILTDGSIAYAEATQEVFFTGDGQVLKGANTQIYQGIWSRKKNKVISVKKLDFGTGAYAHPTVTSDGKVLYFASNRSGGRGGWDIWRAEREGPGWGEPENLGPAVNGEKDEIYPWVLADGTLFLSSNRSGGLGGMDIYVLKPTARNHFAGIEALPFPVNSSTDDICFTTTNANSYFTPQGGFTAFFTTNREGSEDVYRFTKRDKFNGFARVSRNQKPIPNAVVLVEAPDGAACLTRSDAKGAFSFYMESSSGYVVGMNHPEFNPTRKEKVKIHPSFTTFTMQESEYYDLSFWVYDRMNFLKLTESDIEIITNDIDTAHYKLDTAAKFLIELDPGNAYKVKVSHPGYFDWKTQFTAYKGKRKANNNTLKMERKIGTLVRGKLDAEAGTDFSNAGIIPIQNGARQEPLTPSVVNPDGTYEIFLKKDHDFKLYVTLDGLIAGKVEVRTNQNNTAELTDTVDLFIDVKRAEVGTVLFSFAYEEDPIKLQAGVYPEMKEAMSLLEAFPEMKLEFAVHTETRRASSEARRYTKEAAEFGVDYYHYREVPKDRMVAKGYGGKQPLVNCKTKNCSETEHKKNRRVEIRVLDTGK